MKLFCETSSVFELDNDNIKHAAMQRDFLNFCTWQHQKRSNSARLPHFFKLTPSKTKQFGETSFKNGKLSAELTASYQSVVSIFRLQLSKLLRLPQKCHRVIRSAAPVMQNHLSKPEDLMLQNAALLRKSAPGPPNISDKQVSCTAPSPENASLQILFKCPTPAIVFGNPTKPSRFVLLTFEQGPQSLVPATRKHIWTSKSGPNPGVLTFWLRNVLRATMACTFSTSQPLKVVRTLCALCILTSKCASRHNSVHFFDISTSERDVFVAFSLANLLRATTACTFSISQLRKVVRTWGVFSFFYLQNLTNVLHATMLCTF